MFQVNPLLARKNQALLSSKDKSKKLKCRLLQFLFGALRGSFEKFHYAKLIFSYIFLFLFSFLFFFF